MKPERAALTFTLTSTAVLAAIVACTRPSSENESPDRRQTQAIAVHACDGYKPHIDGTVGEGSTQCTDCVQHGRLATTGGDRASCENRAAPTVVDATRDFHFQSWRYKNRYPFERCIEVVVTQYTGGSTSTGFRAAAYGAFDPLDITKSYLGDSGQFDVPTHRFKFTVAALAEFDVVLTGAEVGSAAAESGASYRLDVDGCGGPFVVTSISPTCGSPSGGTKVTIKGSGFVTNDVVYAAFIGSTAHDVTAIDGETLTAVTSATEPGTYDVTVITPDLGPPAAFLAGAFTYSETCPSPTADAGGGAPNAGGSAKTW
jgi:hypothetical protein